MCPGALIRCLAGVAQLVEQRFCKPSVAGSSPIASTIRSLDGFFDSFWGSLPKIEGVCPSGQRERAVNPPAFAYSGSNPLAPTTFGVFAGIAQLVEHQPSKLRVAGSNPVSRSTSSLWWVSTTLAHVAQR